MINRNTAGNRLIEVKKGIIGPVDPRSVSIKETTPADYPGLPQAYFDVAEAWGPKFGGPPLCDEWVAVLKHLLESSSLVLLATHDRHLTELADGAAVRNFHFREDLSSAGMVFDYHLYNGPARTRNALRVLEREGYPPRILADARAWLSQSTEEGSWDRMR